MDWTSLGKQVIALGAPTIGAALGGPVGARVGGVLASILGVEATPEAVGAAVATDDGAGRLREAETAPPADLAPWLAALAANAGAIITQEGSEGPWSYGWRRLAGWSVPILGLWQFLAAPLIEGVAHVHVAADTASVMTYVSVVGGLQMGGHTLKAILGKGAA